MTDPAVVIGFSLFYFIAFIWIGSRYSSEMQTINKLKTLLKSDKFDNDKLTNQINKSNIKIKKFKRLAAKVYGILLIIHLLLNSNVRHPFEYIYYVLISFFGCGLLLIGVFMLKGRGSIDSNARMPGGTRI